MFYKCLECGNIFESGEEKVHYERLHPDYPIYEESLEAARLAEGNTRKPYSAMAAAVTFSKTSSLRGFAANA